MRRLLSFITMLPVFVTLCHASGDNWGLGFHTPGAAPGGNISAKELMEYHAMYLDSTGDKVLYLTFDAGYENGHTAAILDTLKSQNVPAAFFLVGHYIQSAPELTRRMCDEGHIVANHSFHHPDMSKITDKKQFSEELQQLDDLYKETTGKDMSCFYRPPGGKFAIKNLQNAKELGYKTVFWSLAYVDWLQDKQPTREEATKKLYGRAHPGAVILLHSTSSTNAEILDELIAHWKEEGYRFGTLDELWEKESAYHGAKETPTQPAPGNP